VLGYILPPLGGYRREPSGLGLEALAAEVAAEKLGFGVMLSEAKNLSVDWT
jgi:hypothetical protein